MPLYIHWQLSCAFLIGCFELIFELKNEKVIKILYTAGISIKRLSCYIKTLVDGDFSKKRNFCYE